jgi:hypothetical protein
VFWSVFWSVFLELQVVGSRALKLGDMIEKTSMMTYMAETESKCVLLYALYCEGSFYAYFTKLMCLGHIFIMLRLLMLHRSSN